MLSALVEDDALDIFKLFADESVIQYYNLDVFEDVSQAIKLIETLQSRFAEGVGVRWAIRLKETNQLVGTCGFNSWNAQMKSAVIGYDLMSSHWGQGITTEAVNSIVQAAFSGELSCGKLNRIQGDTVLGNSASEALLLKVGFKEEGIRRQSGFWKNQFHDLKCFGLIESEYTQK